MRLFYSTILGIMMMASAGCSGYPNAAKPILYYLHRLPKVKTAHPPVVILLHGVGSNESDLFSFANSLPDNFLVISAQAPYTQGEGRYAWYQIDFSTGKHVANAEQAEKSRNVIVQFIGQLKELHDFDIHQVYLCGFSQGAIMSYSVGLTRPDLIKGIAVLSGLVLDEVKPMIRKGQQLKQLKVFIGHGTSDNVLGFGYATQANAYLNTLGIRTTFKKYPIGHTISKEEIDDLNNWLRGGK